MSRLANHAVHASTESELLGFEGKPAARHFRLFDTMLGAAVRAFRILHLQNARADHRPIRINAILSFGYSLLTRTWLTVLSVVGLFILFAASMPRPH